MHRPFADEGVWWVTLQKHEATLFHEAVNQSAGCSLQFVSDIVGEIVRLIVENRGEEVRNKRVRVAEAEYNS